MMLWYECTIICNIIYVYVYKWGKRDKKKNEQNTTWKKK